MARRRGSRPIRRPDWKWLGLVALLFAGVTTAFRSGRGHETPATVRPGSLLVGKRLGQDGTMETRRKDLVQAHGATSMPVVEDRNHVGSGLLIGIGAWLALGSIWIYPTTIAGQFGSTRDAFFGFLAVAAGLRLHLGNSPSLIASGLAVVSGLFMLAFGLLVDHSSWGAQAQEIGCGLLMVVAAALASRR